MKKKFLFILTLIFLIFNMYLGSSAVLAQNDLKITPKISSKNIADQARFSLVQSVFGGKNKLSKVKISKLKPSCDEKLFNYYCQVFYPRYEISSLKVRMEFGLSSHIFVIGDPSSKKVFFWNRGHSSTPKDGSPRFVENMNSILFRGYTLYLFSMPFMFPNEDSFKIKIPNFGLFNIGPSHNEFVFIEEFVEGSTLKYFVQPQIAVYEKVIPKDSRVLMAGLSGGGWTSTLLAALEPGFAETYSIAGSIPIVTRTEIGNDLGDWEQWLPSIFPKYGYLDLYILATYPNRKFTNIYNSFDECCFSVGSNLPSWTSVVKQNSRLLGGKYSTFLEVSSKHDLGVNALDLILKNLDKIN